jgi:phosphate transport system protein
VDEVDGHVAVLFALVSEALAKATDSLLSGDSALAREVVDADSVIDDLTRRVEAMVWKQIDSAQTGAPLRHLVGLLLILPELERSADLAEHIAQRATHSLGTMMSPLSRGIIQQMSNAALGMWQTAALAYEDGSAEGAGLDDDDEEIDALHDRLTREIAGTDMPSSVAAETALVARFYERLGDHAVKYRQTNRPDGEIVDRCVRRLGPKTRVRSQGRWTSGRTCRRESVVLVQAG